VVTAVLADAGQVVAAGQPVLRIARPEEKEVAIAIPESRLAEIRAAKEITVSLWAALTRGCAASCANWRRPPTRQPGPTPPVFACSRRRPRFASA
jgi:multidrug efflux pump subunit AcrA (membrane-fusion protein)